MKISKIIHKIETEEIKINDEIEEVEEIEELEELK